MGLSTIIITQLLAGLSRASVLFLLSSGLSLIFGVNKVIAFTHGSLYVLTMYISFTLATKMTTLLFGFWLSLLLAPLCVAAVATLLEVVFFRRVYDKEHLMQLVLAMGLVYVLGDVTKFIWGPLPKTIGMPDGFTGSVRAAGIIVPSYYLLVIAAGAATALSLWATIQKTSFGRRIRASAADPNMAKALGVNVSAIKTAIFALGSFMAGFAGALNLPLSSASLGADAEATVLAFIIVIIGGAGSIMGTFVAALIVGIVDSFGILVVPRFAIVVIYLVMVVVLLVRPYGIFGKVTQ